MNRWKVKLVLVVVFILIIYLLLKIRKKEIDRQELPLSIIQPKLEHFFAEPETISIETLVNAFREKHFDGASTGVIYNIEKDTDLKELTFNGKTEKKKRLYLGLSAIFFDSKNDDLMVLDVYRLRRFQCRGDRKKIKMMKHNHTHS